MENKDLQEILKRIALNIHISVEMAKDGKVYYSINKMNGVLDQINKLISAIASENKSK